MGTPSAPWSGGYNQNVTVKNDGGTAYANGFTLRIALPSGHATTGTPSPTTLSWANGNTWLRSSAALAAGAGSGPIWFNVNASVNTADRPYFSCVPNTGPTTPSTPSPCEVRVGTASPPWTGGYNQNISVLNTSGSAFLGGYRISVVFPSGHAFSGSPSPATVTITGSDLQTSAALAANTISGPIWFNLAMSANTSSRPTYYCSASTIATTTTPATTPPPSGVGSDLSQPPINNVVNNEANSLLADSDGVGAFRIECAFSHMNYDDAILDKQGTAHLHTYFGNTRTDWQTKTSAQLLGTATMHPNSTCMGGASNRSAYWVPTMMVNGEPKVPLRNLVYYKSGYQGVAPSSAISFGAATNGLQMIAGDPNGQNLRNDRAAWGCRDANGVVPPYTTLIPTSCSPGSSLEAIVTFPQCWYTTLGFAWQPSTPQVSYGTPSGPSPGWSPTACPAGTTPIPEISFHVDWALPASGSTTGYQLSSDAMPGMTMPAGSTLHADVILAWDPVISDQFMTNCVRVGKSCGIGWINSSQRLKPAVP